jgi:hypothetical protein
MTSKQCEPSEDANSTPPDEPVPDDTLARWPDRSHFSEFDQAIADGLRARERDDEPSEDDAPRSER